MLPSEKLKINLSDDVKYKLNGLLREITHFTEEEHFGIYDFDKADWSRLTLAEINYGWSCWYNNRYFSIKKWLDKFVPHKKKDPFEFQKSLGRLK